MKFNKLFLAMTLILAILVIGGVSAADSDMNLTYDADDTQISQAINDTQISDEYDDDWDDWDDNDYDEVWIRSSAITNPQTGTADDFIDVYYSKSNQIQILVDDELKLDSRIGKSNFGAELNLSSGNYLIQVILLKDNVTRYNSFEHVYVTDYRFEAQINEWQTYNPEAELPVEIYLPNTAKEVTVTYNNVSKVYPVENGYALAGISLQNPGTNIINVTYQGDDKHKANTILRYIKTEYEIIRDYNYENGFDENLTFSLYLPEDANGSLVVYLDNEIYSYSDLVGGKAKIEVKDLKMGKDYSFWAEYNGTDYEVYEEGIYIRPEPKIIFPSKVWIDDEMYLTVKLPSNYNGVLICNGNETEVVNGSGTIRIYELKKYEDYWYDDPNVRYISLKYINSSNDWEFTKDVSTTLVKYPHDSELSYTFENVQLTHGDYLEVIPSGPGYLSGIVKVIFNGYQKQQHISIDEVYYEEPSFIYLPLDDLEYGKYNITFQFLGDDYYKAHNRTYQYEYTYVMLDKNIYDYATVKTKDDLTGDVILYVDGEKIGTESVENGMAIFNTRPVSLGEHDYRIEYLGDKNYAPYTDEGKFSKEYYLEIYQKSYTYPDSNILIVSSTEPITGTVSFTLNGRNYTANLTGGKCVFEIDDAMQYDGQAINVTYSGDEKYYPQIQTYYIYSDYGIIAEYNSTTKETKATVTLPSNLNGNYTFEVNWEFYKTVEVVNGSATLYLNLTCGPHEISGYYFDGDYERYYSSCMVYIPPKATYEKIITLGDNFSVTFEGESDIDPYFHILYPGSDSYTMLGSINLTDGNATVSIDNLPVGEFPFVLSYNEFDFFEGHVTVLPKITSPDEIIKGENYCIIEADRNYTGSVYLILNDQIVSKAKFENGTAKIRLDNMDFGTHTALLDITGLFDEIELNITVAKPSITASNANVLYTSNAKYKALIKVDGKAQAEKEVSITINGKTQTVKTDKNGYASIAINLAPKTYSVKIAYGGVSVSKKVTVKSIVSLKKVTVKKSAKKLVLQATLKKVNGKYLKNKKITFKFNGKKYTAKTNKKGVAKVTVKKAVLKKLKVGKKITYQATYLKDTAKKTVKVKK